MPPVDPEMTRPPSLENVILQEEGQETKHTPDQILGEADDVCVQLSNAVNSLKDEFPGVDATLEELMQDGSTNRCRAILLFLKSGRASEFLSSDRSQAAISLVRKILNQSSDNMGDFEDAFVTLVKKRGFMPAMRVLSSVLRGNQKKLTPKFFADLTNEANRAVEKSEEIAQENQNKESELSAQGGSERTQEQELQANIDKLLEIYVAKANAPRSTFLRVTPENKETFRILASNYLKSNGVPVDRPEINSFAKYIQKCLIQFQRTHVVPDMISNRTGPRSVIARGSGVIGDLDNLNSKSGSKGPSAAQKVFNGSGTSYSYRDDRRGAQ